jgi:polysaccharide deacetylase
MRKPKVLSVFWHSVEPDSIDSSLLNGSNPTASLFRQQIKFLCDNYTPISIREFVQLNEDGSLLGSYKKPPLLMSFDDGFKNVIDQALPILSEFGAPALFFVIAEVVRNPEFVPWYVECMHLVRKTRKTNVVYNGTPLDLTSLAGRRAVGTLVAQSFKNCRTAADRQSVLDGCAELLAVRRFRPAGEASIHIIIDSCVARYDSPVSGGSPLPGATRGTEEKPPCSVQILRSVLPGNRISRRIL